MFSDKYADIRTERLINGYDDDRVTVAGILGHSVLGTVDRVNAKGGLGLDAQLEEAISKVLTSAEDHFKADPVDASSGAVDVAHTQPIDCKRNKRKLLD